MGVLHRCYSAPARFYPGGPIGRIHWFYADKNAKIYTRPHNFFPMSMTLQNENEAVGELTTSRPNPWEAGKCPPQMLGQEYHGTEADFLAETPWPGASAITVPMCVKDSKSGVGVGVGGIVPTPEIHAGIWVAGVRSIDYVGGVWLAGLIPKYYPGAGVSLGGVQEVDVNAFGVSLAGVVDPSLSPIPTQIAGIAKAGIITPSLSPIAPQLAGVSFAGVISPSLSAIVDQVAGVSLGSRISPLSTMLADQFAGVSFAGVISPTLSPFVDQVAGLTLAGIITPSLSPIAPQLAGVSFAGIISPSLSPFVEVVAGVSFGGVISPSLSPFVEVIAGVSFGGVISPSLSAIVDQVAGVSLGAVVNLGGVRLADQVAGVSLAGLRYVPVVVPDNVGGIALGGVIDEPAVPANYKSLILPVTAQIWGPAGAAPIMHNAAWTINFILKPDTLPTGYIGLYSEFNSAGGVRGGIWWAPSKKLSPSWQVSGSWFNWQSTATLEPNVWSMVTVSWGPAGGKTYINGVLGGTLAGGGPSDADSINYAPFIGLIPGYAALSGLLDEALFYNTQLSDAAIAAKWNGGNPVKTLAAAAGLAYGWRFNETALSNGHANDALYISPDNSDWILRVAGRLIADQISSTGIVPS